jgi:uncharacterized protein YjbI with pentapeptide repeats
MVPSMANEELVARLKGSVDEWNQWREQNKQNTVQFDLSGADLSYANLNTANLNAGYFSNASFYQADLSTADLSGANLERVHLSGANLSGANLSRANLSGADLSAGYLRGDDSHWAKLRSKFQKSLSGANLSGANLSGANLINADLRGAQLNTANLSEASLYRANLSGANLSGADFTRSRFNHTIFEEVDLSTVQRLETAVHQGPSTVNINSVILPHDEPTRRNFLRGVGFTETQIDYLPSLLTPRSIQYHSLFISYAHEDEVIAQQLYTDLQKKDVPCWFAPHDLRPGMWISSCYRPNAESGQTKMAQWSRWPLIQQENAPSIRCIMVSLHFLLASSVLIE